ncbi:unnamed protein product [Prunus armeniaca]|uniref:FBD domain-containing protein n=1 Tax=Prunus armeniaca TaxID=36596 RepID=A0A6J5W4Z5_PRUAR|nr:unnamed protein product [Prunus armeniaca]
MSTTCLSNYWKRFWGRGSSDDYSAAFESAFWKGVNEELLHPSLLSFKLRCWKYATHEHLKNFIQSVVKKTVIVLDISVACHGNLEFTLPLEVFQSMDIKVLKIGRGLVIDILPETHTGLHKIHVDISRPLHPSMLGFYHMCPMLQDLRIEGSVKGRDLHKGQDVYWSVVNRYEFHIHAPRLEFLEIDETVFTTFKINELPTLQEARFNSGFFETREHLSGIELWDLSKKVISTFASEAPISKSMIVRDGCLEALGFMFKRMRLSRADEMAAGNYFATIFPSMTVTRTISLEIGHNYAWDVLPYMLSATPRL